MKEVSQIVYVTSDEQIFLEKEKAYTHEMYINMERFLDGFWYRGIEVDNVAAELVKRKQAVLAILEMES